MVATMAKMARVARRENLAKIGMRSLLNNFVVPENPRPFNAEDPARQRQGINPNIEYQIFKTFPSFVLNFVFWSFEFVSIFVLRISNFLIRKQQRRL